MDGEPPNPISLRLERLNTLWFQFRANNVARVCRWMLNQDEVQMLRSYVDSTHDAEHSCPDVIFPLNAECISIETYADSLLTELTDILDDGREALEKEGVVVQWKVVPRAWGENNPAKHFLQNFSAFAAEINPKGMGVAFLEPANQSKFFEKWLFEAVEAGIPDNIRLMVADLDTVNALDKLSKGHPQKVITLNPDLDMPGAMRQLAASAGNPADPGVKFRKAMIEMSQAAAKSDIEACKRLQTIPLTLARENDWMHLEVAVHALLGSALIGAKKMDEAEQSYETARQVAQSAHAKGNPLGATLAAQMLFSKGSVKIARQDHEQAAACFGQAATLSEEISDQFNVMEGRRMEAWCLVQCNNTPAAWQAATAGLAAAEKLDEPIRHNSTLPYLGQTLLDLAYRMGRKDEYHALQQHLTALAGPGWENKTEKRRQTS